MNKKAELEMLRELKAWMEKYGVYFDSYYYDSPHIMIASSEDQIGIYEPNSYMLTVSDIDKYLLENKEKDNEV